MQWLYNLSIKGKILTLTLFMLLLMLVVASVGIIKMGELDAADTRLYENETLGISYMKEANISLIYAGRAMRNVLLSQADSRLDQEHHKKAVSHYEARMEEYLAKAEPLFHSEAGKAKFAELKQAIKTYKVDMDNAMKMANAEEAAGVTDSKRESYYYISTTIRPLADKVDDLMTELSQRKEANAKKTADANAALYHTSRNTMLGILLLAIILGLTIGYVMGNRMGRNAHAIAMQLNTVAQETNAAISQANSVVAALAEGDLTKRFHYQPLTMQVSAIDHDEIGEAMHSLQSMTTQMNGALLSMQDNLNTSFEQAQKALGSVAFAMQSLEKGDFSANINTHAAGEFGVMLVTADKAMIGLRRVIADIATVMSQMNEGDFNARVNANALGDLLSIKNTINGSMDNIAKAVTAISDVVSAQADGDLTKELPARAFKGQLHDLKNAINYSSAKVKDVVIQAIDASNIVNEASAQVSQGSSDLSARVQEQAAALEETSATMNEMSSAVQANTANARKVADLAHQVQHQSVEGANVMHQTIGAMQSIRESSHKIADIVSLIDGIAFQTNLLALNAAVEAARAGEHGRGFAVVASEVRALAQKSAAAAKDIKGLIDDSVTRVENGTQLAEKSGQMLGGITQAVEQVAGMIEEIANASAEQSTGIDQVHKAIAQIDAVTQQNAALVEETTAAAESLSTEANNLRQNMSFFNTGTVSNAHYVSKPVPQTAAKATLQTLPQSKALPGPKASSESEWGEF